MNLTMELRERVRGLENGIAEILGKESYICPRFEDYFKKGAKLLEERLTLLKLMEGGEFSSFSLEELESLNRRLYQEEFDEAYERSYANPTFSLFTLGEEEGREACHLYFLLLRSHRQIFSGLIEAFLRLGEFFLRLFKDYEKEGLKSLLYRFKVENLKVVIDEMMRQEFLPRDTEAKKIIMEADLSLPTYLYQFGLFVNRDDRKVAAFLQTLSDEEIHEMAKSHVKGFLLGYETLGIEIKGKEGVKLYSHLGFERLIREEIRQFKEEGLIVFPIHDNEGANRQVDYDHRNDHALFLDEAYVKAYLAAFEEVLSSYKEELSRFAGPAAIETFGEEPFHPVFKKEATSLGEEERRLFRELSGKKYQLFDRFSPSKERSFSMIAYPLPAISEENYEEIFSEIIRINNLENSVYKKVQQLLIDELDKGEFVHVKGRGGNETDLRVYLQELKNPEKETNFENCGADVNIPVGEVFTTPRLKGTKGRLHVEEAYLNGLFYKDLRLDFEDGRISSYSAANFETEEENKNYVKENLLHHHDTLPMGEFAIGTNTLAYQTGIKYHISGKLPILIAEKTGPHFAVGDTCYPMQEDIRVYNPDGKEIMAKENECSALRKTDISKAYFNCHTDITLPYSGLGAITVHGRDGRQVVLMKDGRFVLTGTEGLNQYLLED